MDDTRYRYPGPYEQQRGRALPPELWGTVSCAHRFTAPSNAPGFQGTTYSTTVGSCALCERPMVKVEDHVAGTTEIWVSEFPLAPPEYPY
jgi:hypothetical protein